MEIAKWLKYLEENNGYEKIDIHKNREFAFISSCENGYLDVAQWLICLGENKGYQKINIHADNDRAFRHSFFMSKNIDVAEWLIHLGEKEGYGQIDCELILKHRHLLDTSIVDKNTPVKESSSSDFDDWFL